VICDRALRYARLAARPERPLTPQEALERDIAEIETLDKGGPIAIADFAILNNTTPADAIAALQRLLDDLSLRP